MSANTIDLREQLLRHLESLRAAGVLFIPRPRTPLAVTVAEVEPEVEAVVDPLESRRVSLETLQAEVAKCDRCSELFSSRTQTVFGTGPLDAEVAFVCQAPGPDEDAQGEPFVGKGGQILGRMIAACGFTRKQVYLLYIIKCRPPKNRTPTNPECANCREFFWRQFDLVAPRHVVALGEFTSR